MEERERAEGWEAVIRYWRSNARVCAHTAQYRVPHTASNTGMASFSSFQYLETPVRYKYFELAPRRDAGINTFRTARFQSKENIFSILCSMIFD